MFVSVAAAASAVQDARQYGLEKQIEEERACVQMQALYRYARFAYTYSL